MQHSTQLATPAWQHKEQLQHFADTPHSVYPTEMILCTQFLLLDFPLRVVCNLISISLHSLLDLSFERVFELRHLMVQLLPLLLCLLFIFILSATLHESESHLLCFGLALPGSPTTDAAAAAAAVAVAVAVECRAEWAAQLFVPHSKQYTHTHTHTVRETQTK